MVETLAVRNPDRLARPQLLQKHVGKRALADARLAADENDLTPAGPRLIERARKLAKLCDPPDESRRFG